MGSETIDGTRAERYIRSHDRTIEYIWVRDGRIIKRETQGKSGGGSGSSGSASRSDYSAGDPAVEGFTDPEDFYDWYEGEFEDYKDAEDYYYEHGGE